LNERGKIMSKGQIAKHFDKTTLKKIGKGALISGTGAVALYLLNWAGTINTGAVAPLIGAVVPIITNIIKEWLKGQK